MNITKIEKYKKLNMTEHKTDMNVTEIQNTKNWTWRSTKQTKYKNTELQSIKE